MVIAEGSREEGSGGFMRRCLLWDFPYNFATAHRTFIHIKTESYRYCIHDRMFIVCVFISIVCIIVCIIVFMFLCECIAPVVSVIIIVCSSRSALVRL